MLLRPSLCDPGSAIELVLARRDVCFMRAPARVSLTADAGGCFAADFAASAMCAELAALPRLAIAFVTFIWRFNLRFALAAAARRLASARAAIFFSTFWFLAA